MEEKGCSIGSLKEIAAWECIEQSWLQEDVND